MGGPRFESQSGVLSKKMRRQRSGERERGRESQRSRKKEIQGEIVAGWKKMRLGEIRKHKSEGETQV